MWGGLECEAGARSGLAGTEQAVMQRRTLAAHQRASRPVTGWPAAVAINAMHCGCTLAQHCACCAGAGSAPIYRLGAHGAAVCAVSFCPGVPGLLATCSTDTQVHHLVISKQSMLLYSLWCDSKQLPNALAHASARQAQHHFAAAAQACKPAASLPVPQSCNCRHGGCRSSYGMSATTSQACLQQSRCKLELCSRQASALRRHGCLLLGAQKGQLQSGIFRLMQLSRRSLAGSLELRE